jgi:hypothetical protein
MLSGMVAGGVVGCGDLVGWVDSFMLIVVVLKLVLLLLSALLIT